MIRIVSGAQKQLETSLTDILDCLDSTKLRLTWKIYDFEGVKQASQELFAGYENILDFERDSCDGKSIELPFEGLLKLSKQIFQIHNAKIRGHIPGDAKSCIKIECFDSWEWTIECAGAESDVLKRLESRNQSDSITIEL